MYNNSTQYPGNQNYSNSAYPSYQQNYSGNYGYQGYGSQYMNPNSQPAPPGEYTQSRWPSTSASYGPPPTQEEAVAQEMKQQKQQLVKQREDYVKKAMVLRRELDLLKNQKQELLSDGDIEHDLDLILKENDKLQEEIHSKMKAIHNVIEMLSSIIKDGKKVSDLELGIMEGSPKNPSAKYKSPPVASKNEEEPNRFCYIHYDTGLHWCRVCDQFPETAKDFLLHLQHKKHHDNVKESNVGDTTPWHKLPPEPVIESFEDAPKKRVPIKGLQFFISAPSWYCKLCDIWIGDLHCASHHLKSQIHSQNYDNFIDQNPHWEMEWLKDREKAMSRSNKKDSSDSDDGEQKKKKKRSRDKHAFETYMKEKKRKKKSKKHKKSKSDSSSSSSSSDSSSDDGDDADKSRSIRVAMRNVKVQSIMNEDLTGKWNMLEKLVEEHKKKEELSNKPKEEDKLLSQWMTVSQPPEKEKELFDSLKDRMKVKQEEEKAKFAEMERVQRAKEKQEKELAEKKEREAKEAQERAEKERKRREQEEYEFIRNKDRNQVRFRTRDHYRKKRSSSASSNDSSGGSPRSKRHKEESPANRERRDSHNGRMRRSRSRSSTDRKYEPTEKKPPGPPSYKKLPFIGRMPLFKNKKPEEKVEKVIQKEGYDVPRRTRFQPGNLARAFIPQPDVVCFPKLSSIPPLMTPPPPKVSEPAPAAPEPPKISETKLPKAPPPPKIGNNGENSSVDNDSELQHHVAEDSGQYYTEMEYNMMYSQMYDYSQQEDGSGMELHNMPLLPPPLPPSEPDDDLAMLGICADDMAAQTF